MDTFSFLLGGWTVERTIDDRRAGVEGTFRGTLAVDADPALGACRFRGLGTRPVTGVRRARYEERGHVRFGDHEGPASRGLVCLGRVDGTMAIEFADGRPFVECDLRTGGWLAGHPCGADRYELRFTVVSTDVLGEHWRVRGPAKDYEAWTTYRRTRA